MKYSTALMLTSCLFLASCMTTTTKTETIAGYLSDYVSLERIEKQSGVDAWRWTAKNFSPANYNKLMISPLVFHPEPETNDQVSKQSLEEIRKQIDGLIRLSAEAKGVPVTNTADTKTLILRSAITSVSVSLKGFSPLEILPIRMALSGVELALGKRDKNISLLLEYEILDGANGKVLVRGIRENELKPLLNSKDKLGLKHAVPFIQDLANDLDFDFSMLAKRLAK